MSLVAISAAAVFNLACTGMELNGLLTSAGLDQQKSSRFSIVYRIDLTQRKWCEGNCETTKRILSIDDAKIILDDTDTFPFKNYEAVNRESGDLISRSQGGNFVDAKSGSCEKKPFTGFPALKF